MYRKFILIIALLACTGITAQTHTKNDYAAIRAVQVGKTLPPEKVYLHFDNTAYYLGETMWFKAFVTSHSEDSPTILSRVLYVELMSPEGYVVKTEKYRIGDDGTCHGSMYMDPLFMSGYYEVRAYTRYMLNWGGDAIFSRVFPVFDKVNKDNWDFRNIRKRDQALFAGETFKKEKEPELKFYPESGHLVDGVTSRVAYELTGVEGIDAYDEITILADGTPLLTTTPEHMGKGCFNLTPVAGTAYTAKVNITKGDGKKVALKFRLPEVEKAGFVLSVDERQDHFKFDIRKKDVGDEEYALTILHRCEMSLFRKLDSNDSTMTVPKSKMREGVNRAIIFCGRTPVAERLFFVQHDTLVQGDRETVKLKVTGNGYMLHNLNAEPHEKISITVEREDGKPLDSKAGFAISVTDQAGRQTTSWGYDMYTYQLLGSEIKGYIPDAQQYFDPRNSKRKEHLDLVMLTNGWTAYNWSGLTAGNLFGLVPPEEGINIRGEFSLRTKNRKFGKLGQYNVRRQPNNLVRIDYTFNNEKIIAETFRTDSLGRFCIVLDDFTGKQTVALSPNTVFRHSKNINYAFFIDKYFSPKPLPLYYWQKNLGSSIRSRKEEAKGMTKQGFNQYLLDEVDVKADYNRDIALTSPISELRLDYLDEWEYAMDVTYRNGVIQYDPNEEEKKKENEGGVIRVAFAESGSNAPGNDGYGVEERDYDAENAGYLKDIKSNGEIVGNRREDASDYVLSVSDVLRSVYKRYDLGWQNWVQPVVIKGEYNRDSIPVTDEKYLHGINVEAMTNFKNIILTSDSRKLQTIDGSWGIWERRCEVLSFKHPYQRFYSGFLSQLGISYPTDKDSRIFDKDATTELSLAQQRIWVYKVAEDMEHPNQIAYLIPDDRDNSRLIKNDLSVSSSTRRYTTVQGYSPEKQFYSPDYSTMVPDSNDFRRTLLWNPNVKPVDGKLHIELYNSSTCNTLAVDALGWNGNTIYSNGADFATRDSDEVSATKRKRETKRQEIKMDSAYWAKCDKEFRNAETYYNKKNYKKALTSYIELVQKGYPAAYYRIGEFYSKGLNLKKRDDLAAQFFENGAALGMPECYYELATMYRNGIHYEVDRQMEVEMLELATALSEPKSTILLSRYLLEGEITEKDTTRAHELLRKEAIKGNGDANYELSRLMECMVIESDSVLGTPFECMERAAKNGSHKALWWMVQHEDSKGNYREAYTLAKELYLHRNIDATMYLAGCFLHGKGVDRDRRLAKDLYREAAKAGNSEAKRILEEW